MESKDYLKNNESEIKNESEDYIALEYERPQFYKRIFSNIFDMILVFLLSLILISGLMSLFSSSNIYQSANETMKSIKLESGFYKDNGGELKFIVDILDENADMTYETKYKTIKETTYTFFSDEKGLFFEGNGIEILHETLSKADILTLVDGKYEKKDGVTDLRAYEFYKDFLNNNALGYVSYNIDYLNATKSIFGYQISIILGSIFFSIIVFYFIVPLIFYRGKKSFGRLIFKISYVDSRGISLSFARFLVKFALFFIVECALSLFTFGIPLFVSITMLGTSKNGQCFSDYISGIYAISSDNKIVYVSEEEYDEKHLNY